MPTYSKPPKVSVNEEQASGFFSVIRDALGTMSKTEIKKVRVIVRKRRAISISFDKDYRPFLSFSAGNTPTSDRVMLSNDDQSINLCKWWFKVKRKSKIGGRFFIQSHRAFTDPKGKPEIVLCEWDWPGQDVVEDCIDLLEDAYLAK